MVNDPGQRLPELPAGLPQDSQHETANLVHSAAVRLLRAARCGRRPRPGRSPSLAAFGVGLRRPAARDQAGRAGAGVSAGDHQDGQRAGVRRTSAAGALRNRPTRGTCIGHSSRKASPGAGRAARSERSPHCLLMPQKRSCRLCARPRTLLRPGSRWAASKRPVPQTRCPGRVGARLCARMADAWSLSVLPAVL